MDVLQDMKEVRAKAEDGRLQREWALIKPQIVQAIRMGLITVTVPRRLSVKTLALLKEAKFEYETHPYDFNDINTIISW